MLLDPRVDSEIFIKLFKNVTNIQEVREKAMTQQIKCCLIKPSLILNPFQIIVAANKAVTTEKKTTKSIYTEIIFNLSITKSISKSLATFGVHESDDSLLLVYLSKDDEAELVEQIIGEELPLEELKQFTDIASIKKHYKIGDNECKVIPVLNSIVSRIVTKDFLSH